MQAQLRERAATSRDLLAVKALMEQDVGRLTSANARLEGEKAALHAALGVQEQRLLAQAEQERLAWNRDWAQLEGKKVAQQAQADQERAAWQRERAQFEGERATQQAALARANQEREAWNRDRAQLEREKVALQAALGAQEEAGRRLESQILGARRELQEYKARVMAAVEL